MQSQHNKHYKHIKYVECVLLPVFGITCIMQHFKRSLYTGETKYKLQKLSKLWSLRDRQLLPKLIAFPSSVTIILWTLLLPDATSLTLTPLRGVKRCGDHRLRPVAPFVPEQNYEYIKIINNAKQIHVASQPRQTIL